MKRILILTFALVASMAFVNCTKDCEECADFADDQYYVDNFVGEYDLNITYTTLVDGVIQEGTSELNGTLSIIAQEDHNYADVVGIVQLSGQEIEFYHTVGTLNDNGELELENSTLIIPASGLTCNMTYNSIKLQDPLEFYSELHTVLSGMPVVYKMNNTCHKH